MKKYAGTGLVGIIILATMLLGGPAKYFIDIPSLILVAVVGGLSLYLVPEKKGKAFIDAGWLVCSIGIIAGLFSLNEESPLIAYGMNVAVATIGLMYGYLFGILSDILLQKNN